MNANEKFLASSAQVDEAAVAPLPNSRKIYVEGSRPDIRVPMREISQADTPTGFGGEKNPPIFVTTAPAPTPTRRRRSTSAPACRPCARAGSRSAATPRCCPT
jgi:phosphomethylpyrimidine synthase